MNLWRTLRQTVTESLDDKLMRLSAALSYYAIFSLAPLLLIAVSVAGAVFGEDAASGVLARELESSMGAVAAEAVQELVANASRPSDNVLAAVVGVSMLLFGAGGVFVQLQDSLNTVWGLRLKEGAGLRGMMRDRLLSFSMVLGVGFLLLISLVVTTVLQGASDVVSEFVPMHPAIWSVVSGVVSLLVITLLFAAIFRVLPDADIAWSDVWLGAAFTSSLFVVGKFVLGWYLGRAATASSYGSAGALVLILLWIFYSSLILLVGAEFTQVNAALRGRNIQPSDRAERVELTVVQQTTQTAMSN